MNINEYLEMTREKIDYPGIDMMELSPQIVCADGFAVSIQASRTHYCQPRTNYGPYSKVEIGYPSDEVPEWSEYAEDEDTLNFFQSLKFWFITKVLKKMVYSGHYPTNTVYPYVPVEIVDAALEQHGGIANGVC